MSERRTFSLGAMDFEVAIGTDLSSGEVDLRVYRTDITPRATVATGKPDYLTLTPGYAHWDVAVLEEAVRSSLEDAPA